MRWMIICSILLNILTQTAAADPGTDARDPADCRPVFGGPGVHERNRAHRRSILKSIREGEHCINVVHMGDWKAPQRVRFPGFRLIEASAGEGSEEPLALVAMSESFEELDCPAGLYVLRVDDSLGEGIRVVGILDDVVLLEQQERLRFWLVPDRPVPVWRIVWESPWSLLRLPSTRGGSSTPARHTSSRPSTPSGPARRPKRGH